MNKNNVLIQLQNIVGKDFVSNNPENLYIYSQDPGASIPRAIDFVIMPKTVEEIQSIVKLANKNKIPLVPMGGGLTLSGLVIPVKGGIVIDMKRMNNILDINEFSKYALIEAGVSTGQILSYLNKNYPNLQPPIPDAPPSATVAGNMLIHGSGYLSQKYGDHGAMINGLEVVLPNGDICKLGSCALSPFWFARGPIPDLIGLFISSFGTMGIVTKLSIQLFDKPKLRDVVFGIFNDFNDIPNALLKITESGLAEDVILGLGVQERLSVMVYVTGESQEEIDSHIKTIKRLFRKVKLMYFKAPDRYRTAYLKKPLLAANAADYRKGGGFEYVGANMPLEKIPEAYRKGIEIAKKHGIIPTLGSRLIGGTHNIVMFFSYSFNRADQKDLENARNALHETNKLALELGGMPWKVELAGQRLVLEKMDPNYKKLLKTIKHIIDPNNIMNPGNWEVN
ncbi:MAG: FAD-binding oxidoreductase [Candidatus Odinarchaeota archaeon]